MSHYDINAMDDVEYIAQYVVAVRGQGLFLSDGDLTCIMAWIQAAGGQKEALLSLLSEIIPSLYQDRAASNQIPSLKRVHSQVMKNIQNLKCSGLFSY